MFYVNVGITNGINGLYGVSETVEVKDMVSLVREPKIKVSNSNMGQTYVRDCGRVTC